MALKKLLPTCDGRTVWPWIEETQRLSSLMPNGFVWPKITIVTPSYNQGQFLEETIRSVLLQGYPNLEYMIIDGGSTDNSVEIIQKYEPWLDYWVSEKDRGQSHAINKGWKRATGKIISWLNSDDYLEEGSLKKVAATYCQSLQESPGLIYGTSKVINSKGEFLYSIGWPFDLDNCLINLIDPMPQPSVFISRKILDEVGLLDECLHYEMDLDLFLRIALRYSTLFFDQNLSYVRYTPVTKTSTNPIGFIKDHVIVLDKIFTDPEYKKRYQYLRKTAYASTWFRTASLYYKAGNRKLSSYYLAKAYLWDFLFTSRKILGRFQKTLMRKGRQCDER